MKQVCSEEVSKLRGRDGSLKWADYSRCGQPATHILDMRYLCAEHYAAAKEQYAMMGHPPFQDNELKWDTVDDSGR